MWPNRYWTNYWADRHWPSGEVGGVTPPPSAARSRGGFAPRRIKRQKIEPRGKTLREMFAQVPALPVVLPEIAPEPIAAPAETPDVPIGTFAPDFTPLIEGLSVLRTRLEAQALAQASEDDDAEVLLMVQ